MMKEITLMSAFSTTEKFKVDESLARTSRMISCKIKEQGSVNKDIILKYVTPESLKKVIEYWKKHTGAFTTVDDDDLKQWDKDFFIDVDDQKTLFDILTTAYYFDLHDLVDLAFAKLQVDP